jgi:hypothetical protein
VPDLTQEILDSGKVTISFKSDMVVLAIYYPLPLYTFPNGATVTVSLVSEQVGQITLRDDGSNTPAMDYCFTLSSSN